MIIDTFIAGSPSCSGASLLSTSNGSLLNATYDSTLDAVVYDVCVQPNSWLAVGYGTSMTNTDMVWWSANGDASEQLDLYSTGHKKPATDAVNSYNTTFTVNEDGSVQFKSVRFLNPNTSPETFIIPLDTPVSMVCAFLPTSNVLQYHTSSNHFDWTLQLSSASTSSKSGCLGESLLSTSNGSLLNATYDSTLDAVIYDVCVQPNSWLAVGYGTSMTNTDMVWWSANGDASEQLDLYSTGHKKPATDAVNSYNTTFTVNDDGSVQFKSVRFLNPNTSPETFIIPLDTPVSMVCAFLPTSNVLQYHTSSNHFDWTLQLSSASSGSASNTSSSAKLLSI